MSMAKLTDVQIRAWKNSGEHFEGRADGDGLYLCFPKSYSAPFWRFRYRFAGKQRAMVIGSDSTLSNIAVHIEDILDMVNIGRELSFTAPQIPELPAFQASRPAP